MKYQLFIILAIIAIFGSLFVQAGNDDSKCRAYAKSHNIMTDEELAKYSPFRMYGVTKKPCSETCLAAFMQIGFEYAGNQACCCSRRKA